MIPLTFLFLLAGLPGAPATPASPVLPEGGGEHAFQPIGTLFPERSSHPAAISKDGRTVVGTAGTGLGLRAFRWTRPTGMQGIHPDKWDHETFAFAVSADGSRIAGDGADETGNHRQAFLWTREEGVSKGLGFVGAGFFSTARAILPDGTVLGFATAADNLSSVVAWTAGSDATVVLVPGTPDYVVWPAFARELKDGRFEFFGTAWHAPTAHASGVSWSARPGFTRLGPFPEKYVIVMPNDMARDGTLVCSGIPAAGPGRALALLPGGEVRELPTPGGFGSTALAISEDGGRIVGTMYAGPNQASVLWERTAHGEFELHALQSVLLAAGVLPPAAGWLLHTATDVSGDGELICGEGLNSGAQRIEGWVARVPRR